MRTKYLALIATGLLLAGCASATDPEETAAETPVAPMLTEMQQEVQDAIDSDPGYATPEEMVKSSDAEEYEEESDSELRDDDDEDQEGHDGYSEGHESDTSETTAASSPEPTPEASATEAAEAAVYSMTMVSENNTTAKCWVAIDGMAYDLTGWVSSHPGGSSAISNLCGKDGTSLFLSQHGGQPNPDRTLDGYLLGPITG